MEPNAQNLNRQQLTELRAAFNMFDTDHSGDISKLEYKTAIKKLVSSSDIELYMNLFGNEEDHKMDFEEFKKKMRNYLYPEEHSVQSIVDAFHYFDIDHSGSINMTELKLVLKKFSNLSQESVADIMAKLDKDHNRVLSLDEFKELLTE